MLCHIIIMVQNLHLLRLLDLPSFETYTELARLMHLDSMLINRFFKYSYKGYYYKEYAVYKGHGKYRTIRQPVRSLKAAQAWILRNVLDKLTPSSHATAFIRGKNLEDNVAPHSNNRCFLCLDLEDFFPSVKMWRVVSLFRLLGYSNQSAFILARICTCKNSLPQGAVTSPSLSNFIAGKLDRRLAGYVSRRNVIYTRYADDMTFSSNDPRILHRMLPIVKEIITTSGFTLNDDKERKFGPRCRCCITGLVKDSSNPRFGIGRKKKREMRVIMHKLIIKGTVSWEYPNEASIEGWLSYLQSVDNESYKQMFGYYEKLKQRKA